MSVHETAWRVSMGERSMLVRRKREVERFVAQGATAKAVRFEVRWREGSRTRAKAFKRRRDAERFDAEVWRRLEVGERIVRRQDVPTLAELADGWVNRRMADVEAGELALGTLSEQAALLDRYVIPDLGHLPLIDLRPRRLDEWIETLRVSGASNYRIRKAASLVTRLLSHAVRLEYLPANPARELELPRHRYRRGRAASPLEVERIRAYFRARERLGDAALISVLADGLRPAEALATTWSAFDGRRLHVVSHLRDGQAIEGTKRGRRVDFGPSRSVQLAKVHAEDLREWRQVRGGEAVQGLVFPRAMDGLAWRKYDWDNWRKRSFFPAAGNAGLLEWDSEAEKWIGDFIPYDLRHTCASIMLAAGRPIAEVAEHLGHGVDVCARTYAHTIESLKGKPPVPVDEAIRTARSELFRGDDVR